MHAGQKAGESDKNLTKTITSKKEVEVNHQSGEIHKTGKILDMNSALTEDSYHNNM